MIGERDINGIVDPFGGLGLDIIDNFFRNQNCFVGNVLNERFEFLTDVVLKFKFLFNPPFDDLASAGHAEGNSPADQDDLVTRLVL